MNGEPAAIGDTVVPGATVATEEGAYCEILFGVKNIFRVLENTVAIIRLEKGRGNIQVDKGAIAFLLTRLSALEVEKPEFLVETPSAAFGVRGTAFFVAVENTVSTYVCACNGELQVEDAAGANSQKLAGVRHKALRIARTASGGYQVSSPGLLYHDDDDMDSLADRIDETIPWGRPGY
ncbi:FecR domain-containing protein [Marispirochaeta sp.]|uniref:FecR domain-containing protein n=1 Tax=Marispirochaeta sp. TaxID=2038653 RepID=UPI0029C78FB5|nr:FecR domain-containing protein [Marispirochaeta sp.]